MKNEYNFFNAQNIEKKNGKNDKKKERRLRLKSLGWKKVRWREKRWKKNPKDKITNKVDGIRRLKVIILNESGT